MTESRAPAPLDKHHRPGARRTRFFPSVSRYPPCVPRTASPSSSSSPAAPRPRSPSSPPRAPPQQQARHADATRARRDAPRSPEQRIAQHVQRLDQQLTLTDRQEAQIRQILLAQAAQHQRPNAQRPNVQRPGARPQPRAEGTRPDRAQARPQLTPEQREQRRTAMRAEVEATQRQIVAVLTPQQAERYQSLQAEHRTRAEQQRGQRQDRRSAPTPRQGRKR